MSKSGYIERVVLRRIDSAARLPKEVEKMKAHKVEMAIKRLRVRVDQHVAPGAAYTPVVMGWGDGAEYGIQGEVCFVRTDRVL